jgi:hypothetical protein
MQGPLVIWMFVMSAIHGPWALRYIDHGVCVFLGVCTVCVSVSVFGMRLGNGTGSIAVSYECRIYRCLYIWL